MLPGDVEATLANPPFAKNRWAWALARATQLDWPLCFVLAKVRAEELCVCWKGRVRAKGACPTKSNTPSTKWLHSRLPAITLAHGGCCLWKLIIIALHAVQYQVALARSRSRLPAITLAAWRLHAKLRRLDPASTSCLSAYLMHMRVVKVGVPS